MAHLLIITGGLMGLVNPACAVATRLRRAGHRVTYASPAPIREVIEARGLTFHALPPSKDHWSDGRGPLDRLLTAPMRRRAALDALGVDGLVDEVTALAPDAVLLDLERHAHIMSLSAAGFRLGLLSIFLSIHERPRVPPLHTDLIPAPGPAGEEEVREAWAHYRPWKRRWLRRRRWRGAGVSQEATLRRHARRVGFPVEELEDDQWLIPFSYRSLPVFVMHALEFDFLQEPRPTVRYLGAMVDLDRPEAPVPADDEARLDALLDARAVGSDRRLVLVSLSTAVPGNQTLIGRLVEAVRDAEDLDVVLGLGGRHDPADLPPLPPHVHAFGYLPQMRVLPHADAAIATAGANSMAECVLHRVPMLVYSLGVNDQEGNAARVAHHGLGIVGRRDDGPGEIARDLRRVLVEPGFRQRVEAMRELLLAADTDDACARAIEEMLELPRPGEA